MVRPDTEVTVLVPERRYVGFWRRVLHDQTSAELTEVLGELKRSTSPWFLTGSAGAVGSRPVPSTGTEIAATRSSGRRTP